MDGDAAEIVPQHFALSRVDSHPDLQSDGGGGVPDGGAGADCAGRTGEAGEEPISGLLHLGSAEVADLIPSDVVVLFEQSPPGVISLGGGSTGRIDDVGEHHRQEHAVRSGDRLALEQERLAIVLEVLLGPFEVVGVESVAEHRGAEHVGPFGHRHHVCIGRLKVEGPCFHVLFRPEEVHAASIEGARAGPRAGERRGHVADRRLRGDFEQLVVSHANPDLFAAIEAARNDGDLSSWEQPAHGQRLHASLAVPARHAVDLDLMVGGHVAERRPRFDEVGISGEPIPGDRSCTRRRALQFPGLFEVDVEDVGEFGIVRRPA